MAQPYLEKLESIAKRPLREDSDLVCKHFFSGAALYSCGTICATFTPAGLAFKLPEALCSNLIDSGAAAQLKYFAKSPIKKGYALFSEPADLDDKDIAKYLKVAIAYAHSTNT